MHRLGGWKLCGWNASFDCHTKSRICQKPGAGMIRSGKRWFFGAANPSCKWDVWLFFNPSNSTSHQIIIGGSTKFPPRITHPALGVPAKFETKSEDPAHGGPEGINGRVFERFKRALWIHRCARLILKKSIILSGYQSPAVKSWYFYKVGPYQS